MVGAGYPRALIMGWMMLLVLAVLVIVNLATRQSLLEQVERHVSDALNQESGVGRLASVGIELPTRAPAATREDMS